VSKKLVVAANRHRRTYLGRLSLTQVSCWSIFFVLVVACWPEYFFNSPYGVHRFGNETKRISSARSMGQMRLSTSCSHILAYAVKGSSRYIPKQYNPEHQTLKTCALSREANIGDSRKTVDLGLLCALYIWGNVLYITLVADGGHDVFRIIKYSLNALVNDVVQRFSRDLPHRTPRRVDFRIARSIIKRKCSLRGILFESIFVWGLAPIIRATRRISHPLP